MGGGVAAELTSLAQVGVISCSVGVASWPADATDRDELVLAADFLGEAIESVLAQEGVNVRVFVIDDASTDETASVAAAIAEKADLTKEQANRVLNAVLEEITGALHRKDSVTLVGFGTFLQRHRGARTGKNPQTGEPVKIKASNTVAFKPGKSLKDSVNP